MKHKLFRFTFLLLLAVGVFSSFGFAPKKQDALDKAIYDILKGFKEQDSILINSYVHPKLGLTILFRPGAMNTYSTIEVIDFNEPIPSYMPYDHAGSSMGKIHHTTVPDFDCDTETWTKTGIYCGAMGIDKLLLNTVSAIMEFEMVDVTASELMNFETIERNSVRIVAVDPNSGELVFHLTLIDGKWHLSVLDRLTAYCDA